ncbi:MAG TPA: ATPase [Bryobacteraceae bacterium]|nr:ATPase [Bryobacteraceae bacterium]
MTILCLASYEKGQRFLIECKRLGATVLLVTSLSLKDKAKWPLESIDEIFYMPNGVSGDAHQWDRDDLVNAISHLGRTHVFDRIVGLDDFDVETAAMLREHMRTPGSGESTARYYRDKLAMRVKALESGIAVPDFIHVLNYDRLREFMDRVPAPWVLKPRSMAGAIGIKKVHNAEELWRLLDELGDMQSHYLLERFVPGDIFHVDSVVFDCEIRFALASGYGRPPMEVAQKGGVFTSRVLDRKSQTARKLIAANARVMKAFGLARGVSHTEFIRAEDDGRICFLETSSRVGGAHVSDLIEAATGVNPWTEWARVELAETARDYPDPRPREDYAGLLVSLARRQYPDLSGFADPEVVWRMNEEYHVGLIVRSPELARVEELLAAYTERVQKDFWAYAPPKDRPSH